MQKLIFIVVLLLFCNIDTYAQSDTIKIINKQVFFKELKKFDLDSNDIAGLYNKESKQAFFYKMLNKIYTDDSLSKQQSFYALIFTFPEFSNLISNYDKLKKGVYDKSTKYFREKMNGWAFVKETFENELIMIEEQVREEQIQALENKHKEEEIEKDNLALNTDSTKIVISNPDGLEKDNLKKIENRLELEKRREKEEERKMQIEQRRMEEERKKMELEEEKKNQ